MPSWQYLWIGFFLLSTRHPTALLQNTFFNLTYAHTSGGGEQLLTAFLNNRASTSENQRVCERQQRGTRRGLTWHYWTFSTRAETPWCQSRSLLYLGRTTLGSTLVTLMSQDQSKRQQERKWTGRDTLVYFFSNVIRRNRSVLACDNTRQVFVKSNTLLYMACFAYPCFKYQ